MAFDFDGVDDYLYAGLGLAPPLTLACWFCPDNVTSTGALLGVYRNASNGFYALTARGDLSGDPIQIHQQNDGGGNAQVSSSSGYTAGSWYHACGIVASSSDRRVLLNGGNKGTSTAGTTLPSTPVRTGIGIRYLSTNSSPFNGKIVLPAAWSAALTDEEAAALASGAHPTTIRPDALVECWELAVDGIDPGFLRSYGLSFPGSPMNPTWLEGTVPIHRGRSPLVVLVPTATAPVDLVVADASFPVSFESPVLSQVHGLAAQDVTLPVAFDQVTLTQVHQLTAADATFPTTFDSPALTQLHELAVDDASLPTSFENVTLTQGQTLVVQDATLPVAFDSPALEQVHALTASDSALPVTFDSPGLTQAHQLAADDANIAVLFESPTLFQAHSLTADDATLPTLFDSVTLTSKNSIYGVLGRIAIACPGATSAILAPAPDVEIASPASMAAFLEVF